MSIRWTVRTARLDYIDEILSDICAQHKAEWAHIFGNLSSARGQIVRWIAGEDQCISTDVGFADGVPAVAFGIIKYENEYATWLLASERYFSTRLSGLRFSRMYLSRAAKLYRPLASASHSTHPDVDKWMIALGYEKTGEDASVAPPLKTYRYVDKTA